MVEDPGQKSIFNAERSRAGRERVSEGKNFVSRTGGILAQNILAAWKTSRRKKIAHTGFEREVFVLSSGELITATTVVQRRDFAKRPWIACGARGLAEPGELTQRNRRPNFQRIG
jgi:dihydrodipicolinate reductase